jgi:hypothetical protein
MSLKRKKIPEEKDYLVLERMQKTEKGIRVIHKKITVQPRISNQMKKKRCWGRKEREKESLNKT